MQLKQLSQSILAYTGQKSWLDFALGITLCIMLAGSFFLPTGPHRDVMYASLPLGLFFLHKNNSFNIKDLMNNRLVIFSALFIFLNILSILWSSHNDTEMTWTTFKIAPFLTICILSCAAYLIRYDRGWDYLIDSYILCGITSGILLLIISAPHIWDTYIAPPSSALPWRLKGFGRAGNSNLAGLLYSISIIVLLFKPTKIMPYMNNKYFMILGVLVLGFTLFLTLSRGAFIAFIATILILCALKVSMHIKNKAVLLFTPLILLTILAGLTQLFPNITTYMIERGASGRFEIWALALDKFLQSPILGQGSATRLTYAFFFEHPLTATHEHNIYLSVLTDLGAIGFLSFTALLITTWVYALHYARKTYDYSTLGMITYGYIFGLFDLSGYYVSLGPSWVIFWLPLAFLMSKKIKENLVNPS